MFLLMMSMPVSIALTGCCEESTTAPESKEKYNIIFITTDQEAYMPTFPQESNYAARERLRSLGTTFEKHYACSNVSTSSRSVMYTGRHVTETKMLDNTNEAYYNKAKLGCQAFFLSFYRQIIKFSKRGFRHKEDTFHIRQQPYP